MRPFDFNHEKYHMGHFILDSMCINSNLICQIDAATGESETNGSVLRRSIQLARCMRLFGLKPGDVMTLGGRHHLDLNIPLFAATMIGLPVAGLDLKFSTIKDHFKLCLPKIAFCDEEYYQHHLAVVKMLALDTKVISFGDGEYSMKKFIDEYDDVNDNEKFAPLDFDLNKIYALLLTTSGTTSSLIKMPAFTHKSVLKNILGSISYFPKKSGDINDDNKPAVHVVPFFWMTSYLNTLGLPYIGRAKLTTSVPVTADHVIDMINKYKPIFGLMGPPLAKAIIENEKECDFTCFELLTLGGSKAQENIVLEFRKRIKPSANVAQLYGLSETFGAILAPNKDGPVNSCGRHVLDFQKAKLMNPVTCKEGTEPNVPGEMWAMPAFTILPAEIENVIRKHPGVKDVAVTSIPHEKDGEHPVACVVRKKGFSVTTQELLDMITNELSKSTQLYGGVVFIDEIPLTSSGKHSQIKLREIALFGHRE